MKAWWQKFVALWSAVPAPEVTDVVIRAAQPSDAVRVAELLAGGRSVDAARATANRIQAPFGDRTTDRRERACVAVVGERVVGVMAYDILSTSIDAVEIYVHPDFRGRGVGTRFVELVSEFCSHTGRRLVCTVRGRDVHGLKWLSRRGLTPLMRFGGRRQVQHDGFGDDDAVFLELRSDVDARPRVRIAR